VNELPAHLAGQEARGLVRGEPVAQLELGPMQNLVYLLVDWASGKVAIVDPQLDLAPPLRALEAHGLTLDRVFLTHTHHDHVAGVPQLVRERPALPVTLHEGDRFRIDRLLAQGRADLVKDGDRVPVGGLAVRALHTPGHSAGHTCWLFDAAGADGALRRYALTGDTLFIRQCGRTDLETGDDAAMFRSLRALEALPDDTVVLPGHHYEREVASTIAREKATNPPLRARSVEELAALP
jgi:hydroxyacylglutathione hydrolase